MDTIERHAPPGVFLPVARRQAPCVGRTDATSGRLPQSLHSLDGRSASICEEPTANQAVETDPAWAGTLPGIMAGKRPPRTAKLALVAILLTFQVRATTYYVAKTGSDANPGTEAEPWLTIARASTTLMAGDTVLVKQGTYDENLDVNDGAHNGTAENPIVYKSYDGWNTIVTGHSRINRTHIVLDGFKVVRDSGDVWSCTIKIFVDSCSVLNCEVTAAAHDSGGQGVELSGQGSIISGNTIHGIGLRRLNDHGIYAEGKCLTYTYNTIYDCASHGIHQYSENGTSRDSCLIAYNTVFDCGSNGIMVRGSYNRIHNNLVYDNGNAGIKVYSGSNTQDSIWNNTICNCADWSLSLAGTYHYVKNNIVIGTRPIAVGSTSDVDHNCYTYLGTKYYLNGHALTFAAFQDSGFDGHGLNTDPFVTDTAKRDFHLTDSSPCIDAGDPATPVGYDPNGIVTPQGSAIDMGAYEHPAYDSVPRRENTQSVSFAIAPNPLSGGFAAIRSSLPSDGLARVEVFNASGRLVRPSSVIGHLSSFRLDLRSVPAGVYLVRVTADGSTATQKLVVMR